METIAAPEISPLWKRLLVAIPLFLTQLTCYFLLYIIVTGMMYWDGGHFGRMPWYGPHYLKTLWPDIMLFWSAAAPYLVLLGKNWKWWIACVVIGMFSVFAFACGWILLLEIYGA